ncbi:hypothetical protein OG365_40825 (plasmid) [Streptomyces sp. NBC_00853]|uniref:hypothetical protein n=1 Tax=Streptomyces sp. NBC_00853 TaxID=2903681 RepID=UPI002F91B7FA|nr:hypothetical protein OG365_40825 [Streptomyces sp. NBC_00853]
MPTTVFDQFTCRTADVTAQLTTLGIPLTAPAPPPADADPTDPWASSYAVPVDRSTLAWCTAVQMLADHHDTGIDRQVLAADALLRELGVRGLAQLHFDLHHGAPVDYRFTRCPYCSGIGEDPPPGRTARTSAARRGTSSTATSTCARCAAATTTSPSGSPKST